MTVQSDLDVHVYTITYSLPLVLNAKHDLDGINDTRHISEPNSYTRMI